MYIINIEVKVRFNPGKALVVKLQKPFIPEEVRKWGTQNSWMSR